MRQLTPGGWLPGRPTVVLVGPSQRSFARASSILFGCILIMTLFAVPMEAASTAQEHLDRARAAYRKGHLTQAAEEYRAALALFETIGDKAGRGICLTGLGRVHLDQGDHLAAQSYSEQAVALYSAFGDRRGLAHSFNNLGLALSGQGRYSEALSALQKALTLNQQDNDAESTAINYGNIGLIQFYRGQYLEALRDYHKALEIIEAHSAAEWAAARRWSALNSLGAVYKKLGWHEKALGIYLNLLKAPAPDPKALVYARNNIGAAYRSLGDPIKAKDYYEQALAEAVRLENKSAQALLLKNLGLIYALHLRDNTTAAKHLSASLALSTALHDRYEEANTCIYLGEVARRQGQHVAAHAAYEKALAIAGTLAFREAQWTALYGLGQLREIQGDLPGAQSYYQESITVIEAVRATLRGESLRTGFLADKIEVYEAALRTLLAEKSADPDDGRMAKAFEYTERAKARVMLDRLSEAVAHIEEGVPTDLRRRRQQLLQALAQRPAGSTEGMPTDAESQRRQAIERELEAIDLRILEANPRYALVQQPKIVTLVEAQRLLQDRDDALIVFFTGKQSIFAWFITQAQARFLRLPNPAALEAGVQTYVRQLTNPASTAYLALSTELYDTLLQPILATAPSTINKLIIIPDGFLNMLPFETLQGLRVDGGGRTRGFLIERYEISYAPSVSTFAALRRMSRRHGVREKALLGLSVTEAEPGYGASSQAGSRRDDAGLSPVAGLDRLPYADQELMRIRDHVPGAKEIYLQGHSTKPVLQQSTATHFKAVHFATHSVINEEAPESSFILLSPNPTRPEDALLCLYEILNLRLDTEMVVLSSCRSGLGKKVAGEGIIGFTQAFMYAGARSVVTTFWEINDEATLFFMEQFYYHLGRGASVAEALRRAKLKFISSSRYAHPFYWGAFAINGDAALRVYQAAQWKGWAPAVGGVALVLFWVLFRGRKREARGKREEARE